MNIAINNFYLSNVVVLPGITPSQKEAFNKFEKAWSYAGKSLLVTRHILNTVLSSCRWIALSCETRQSLRDVVLRLKIFSIVSIPLNMTSMPGMFNKVMNNVHWKDAKGILLSSLSATVLMSDTLDSITTFANTTAQLLSKPAISAISGFGLPLAYTIVGIGSVVRLVKIKDVSDLLSEVERGVVSELNRKQHRPEELKALLTTFVDGKLPTRANAGEMGQTALQDLKRHQEAVLERQGNSKVVRLINSLAEHLDSEELLTEEKSNEIIKILNEVVDALRKEKRIQCGYLVSNLFSATALSLFLLPGFSAIPFSLMATSMIIRISLQAHQDFS